MPAKGHLRRRLVAMLDAAVGKLAALGLRSLRRFDRKRTADFAGRFLRQIGPWLPEHKVGRTNLQAAYPEKSPTEVEQILRGVWDNLGRFGAEFAHLDRLTIHDPRDPKPCDIEFDHETQVRFETIRDSGKPVLMFAAHLGNWELPALVAHHYGLKVSVLYRRPNLPSVADAVVDMRAGCMGTLVASGTEAPFVLAKALEEGGVAGMLVDQHDRRGVDVRFFGRAARTSALIARLARQVDCPIQGVRVIRLPDNRFRIELTEPIAAARAASGEIGIEGTMQAITSVIESWVREHPEQWLWLHQRWRAHEIHPREKYRQALAVGRQS
jgi:KDO2-lipid IV(A) lauroyltransferase